MSKNPYEMRFDMFNQAKEIMMAQYYENLNFVRESNERLLDTLRATGEGIEKVADNYSKMVQPVPKFPSFEDISKYAEWINGFVSNGK